MAVVYLDLDGFKQINNTLGNGTGDVLLKMVAGRLTATVREEDTVARLGGDEFVIALWHLGGPDYAATVALKVIEAVSQPYVLEGQTVSVTTSAGVGIYPIHGEDADTLMKSADLALYEAKHAGTNAYRMTERTDLSTQTRSQSPPSCTTGPLTGSGCMYKTPTCRGKTYDRDGNQARHGGTRGSERSRRRGSAWL